MDVYLYSIDFWKQIEQLKNAWCGKYFNKNYRAKLERPELNRMLEQLREGYTINICNLTRLGKSTKDLFKLLEIIEEKGANIKA